MNEQAASIELPVVERRLGLHVGEGHFTPALNAALNLLVRDETLPFRARLQFNLWRLSWGCWTPNSVPGMKPAQLHLTDDVEPEVVKRFNSALRAMVLAPRECPGCGLVRRGRRPFHPQFRWHVECLAKTFAVDAITHSLDPEERQWAREVLAGEIAKDLEVELCQ